MRLRTSLIVLLLKITLLLSAQPLTTQVARAQERPRRVKSSGFSEPTITIKVPAARLSNPHLSSLVAAFGTLSPSQFRNWLDAVRPAAPSLTRRQEMIAAVTRSINLPVFEDSNGRYKLSERAGPALRFFHREHTKFIIVPHVEPQIETVPGACIVITTGLLTLFDTDEQLNGLVAHELAHEFSVNDYLDAQRLNDTGAMRRIELQCDAIAACALHTMKMEPRQLGIILFKTITWSAEKMRANDGTSLHPSLLDRLQLNEQLSKALKTHGS